MQASATNRASVSSEISTWASHDSTNDGDLRILVLVDHTNLESAASSRILVTLSRQLMDPADVAERRTLFLIPPDVDMLPREAQTIILFCSNGCFAAVAMARMLEQAAVKACKVIPVTC